jgi:hypothetical protein
VALHQPARLDETLKLSVDVMVDRLITGILFWTVTEVVLYCEYSIPSNALTVQFQTSLTVRLPGPMVVISLFTFAVTLVEPEVFRIPFLYHCHSTRRLVFSKSDAVELHTRVELVVGDVGVRIGPTSVGAALLSSIVTVLEFRYEE